MKNIINDNEIVNKEMPCEWPCTRQAATSRLASSDIEESRMYLCERCADLFDRMNNQERIQIAYIQGKTKATVKHLLSVEKQISKNEQS